MDSDQGKLFVGGISWETTEEKLTDYFKAYGDVAETVIMKDRTTGRARGFGFVVFSDPAVADRVLLEKHAIDGRTVETKKAVPRDEQQNVARSNMGGPGSAGQFRTKKIFVGGLAPTVTEEDFRKYFEQFGTITDVVVMYDHNTQRTRGFGFITFDSEDAVEQVLQKPFHELNEKMVEVKRAVPKELSQSSGRGIGGGSFGAGSGRGTGYGAYSQSFNSSPGAGGYGARPGAGRGGYSYATPGYGAGGYTSNAGYAAGMNGGYGGASYGAAAPYGNATGGAYAGGYGMASTAPGYGTPAAYGGAASGGYNSTQAGGRSGWGGAGSASAAYGTTVGGYGSTEAWGTAAAAAQPAGATAYTYAGGDSGYGPNGSSYSNKSNSGAGYANSGAGGGSYPSGYGEMYGGSGYNDGSWKPADPYNSTGVGSGGSGGGGYGVGPGVSAEVAVNGPSDFGGSYGAAGKQTPRGPDARFRPYPATTDRSS